MWEVRLLLPECLPPQALSTAAKGCLPSRRCYQLAQQQQRNGSTKHCLSAQTVFTAHPSRWVAAPLKSARLCKEKVRRPVLNNSLHRGAKGTDQ